MIYRLEHYLSCDNTNLSVFNRKQVQDGMMGEEMILLTISLKR